MKYPAIVTLKSCVENAESNDCTEVLTRMYIKWIEKNNYIREIAYLNFGQEAGMSHVTFFVKDEGSYDRLKFETGIHRIVRLSPFDAANRRHTSFVQVLVYPDVGDEIELNPQDLTVETYRPTGLGGQQVNYTDCSVKIIHIPTGIIITTNGAKSMHKNKVMAIRLLQGRLKVINELGGLKQVRSYIFDPYQLVKDYRLGIEVEDIEDVLNGNIDMFLKY